MLNTPIAFIIFNRPETTQKVFNEIKKIQPKQLFVIADGPREKNEKEICDKTRDIINQINWDCDIHKNYSDINLGCRKRVSSGLNWFFKNTEQGIILEDDCLPSQSFFQFCEKLLNKYKDNNKIMQIAGTNTQEKNIGFKCSDSYYYSNIAQIWGWATWRRAWNNYDVNLTNWPKIKYSKEFRKIFTLYSVREYWKRLLQEVYENKNPKKNTWDAQWFFHVIKNQGISIVPKLNLITNIGFGEQGTHAKSNKDEKANLEKTDIIFPLKHPIKININKQADQYTWKFVFKINNTLKKKIKCFFRQFLPKPYFYIKFIYKKI